MKDKKILKNYIILVVIFVVVFMLMLYISKWNHVYNDYKLETPVIRGTLSYEITENDFEHYVLDNPNSIIYMCTSSDQKCRDFEKDLKKLVIKKNLEDRIIYLNLTNANKEEFVNSFNTNYPYKIKLTTNLPALVELVNGKVTSMLQVKEDNILTMEMVNDFININHIDEVE